MHDIDFPIIFFFAFYCSFFNLIYSERIEWIKQNFFFIWIIATFPNFSKAEIQLFIFLSFIYSYNKH